MRTLKSTFSILALGALYASAAAQSAAVQESLNYYTVSTSSYGVSVSSSSYGYNNGIYGTATGAGYNIFSVGSYAGGDYPAYAYSYNYSAAFGPGSASQFNGEAVILQFTNNTEINETFGVSENLYEYLANEGNASAVSYGGFLEFGGAGDYGYNTIEIDPGGVTNLDYQPNFTGGYVYDYSGESLYEAMGGFTDTIAPGQTIDVEVWASGSSNASAASSVPGPAAALSFGLIGLVRRRRK